MYVVLLTLLLLLCVAITVFFSFCYVDTVCGFATDCLDLIDYNFYTVLQDVRVCIGSVLLIPACCCVVCCYTAVAAAAAACCCLLLLAAANRHRVPEGKVCSRGSLHLIPVFSFSSFKHDFFHCTPWQYCRIFSVDFFTHNAYHTSSVLRACVESRRALARRSGAPLVRELLVCLQSAAAVAAAAAAAAALVCCYSAVVAPAAALLLPAAVRYRVSDGRIWCCGSLNLIPAFCFYYSSAIFFQCTPCQCCCVALTISICVLHPR